MDIFESLENLNVSEECFEDITRMIEESLYNTVQRAYDKGLVNPEWWDNDVSRWQVNRIDNEERKAAAKRDPNPSYLGDTREQRLKKRREDKSSPYNDLGDYEPPEEKDWNKSKSKSVMRHYEKLAKDVLSRHNNKKISENIDDVKANLDRERAKRLEDVNGKGRYGGKAENYLSYLTDFYKNRVRNHELNSQHRNEYGDHSLFDYHQAHDYKGGIPHRRREYGGDQANYDSSKGRILHSIAKHLKKKSKMSESLMYDVLEEAKGLMEDLLSQAVNVAYEKYPRDKKEERQKLIDKAVDAQYGVGKYRRDLTPHKPTKNEVGEKKTDMRRPRPGSKSEEEAIEASKFRNEFKTGKERRDYRKAEAEINAIQAAERAVGA